MRVRIETFGGIVATEKPPLLVFADRKLTRKLGQEGGPRWSGGAEIGLLSGPVEVHLSVTGLCHNGCAHCYSDSRPDAGTNTTLETLKRRVDALAEMGVFHIALGGGEPFLIDWIFDLARYIRAKNMVPNVTTSGSVMTEEKAKSAAVFGQVNVSLDGVGDRYAVHRGYKGFEPADRALRLLRKHVKRVGINCVVSRKNFNHLEEVLRYARSLRLDEVEFLRYKPSGRAAADTYHESKLTPSQAREFFPKVFEWGKTHKIRIKTDCSFVPFLCYHDPGVERMQHFSVMGCIAGNYLMAVDPEGRASGCSFWPHSEGPIEDQPARWAQAESFQVFRSWTGQAPEPCAHCEYLDICRGGCRAVAVFSTGDPAAPDPECPKVQDYLARNTGGTSVGD